MEVMLFLWDQGRDIFEMGRGRGGEGIAGVNSIPLLKKWGGIYKYGRMVHVGNVITVFNLILTKRLQGCKEMLLTIRNFISTLQVYVLRH